MQKERYRISIVRINRCHHYAKGQEQANFNHCVNELTMLRNATKAHPNLLWACIARDDTILVEAGEDTFDGCVSATAKELLK